MRLRDPRRFWDARAREDAYWFVDTRGAYGQPDLDRFWASGEADLDALLGLEDASATVVISNVVFQHLPDPETTLGYVEEMGRVLRPGGWAAFQVSNDPERHRPRGGAARRRLAALTRRGPRGREDPRWL